MTLLCCETVVIERHPWMNWESQLNTHVVFFSRLIRTARERSPPPDGLNKKFMWFLMGASKRTYDRARATDASRRRSPHPSTRVNEVLLITGRMVLPAATTNMI